MKQLQLVLCFSILLCSFFSCTTTQEGKNKQPNIILIMADDLGWRDVGFNGSQFYETPNLDRLAEAGIQFSNAYANAPNCAPTRASIMAGQYTFRHEVLTVHRSDKGDRKAQRIVPIFGIDTLKASIQSIPEKLKPAGYRTAHFGKWHLGNDPQSGPLALGFDFNVGGWETGAPKSYFSPYQNPALEDGPKEDHLTDRLTNEVIDYLNLNKESEQALYINFWTYGVHSPFQTKPELKQKYNSKTVADDQNNATYAGMIEVLDENIGRLIETLEHNGQMDNTIILFFSDNGGSWNATVNTPLKGAKGTLYEGGIRVPAFVYAPGLYEGERIIDYPIISTDFYPTFMDWAGIAQTEQDVLDGQSIVPLLEGTTVDPKAIYWYSPVYLPARKIAQGAYAFRTTPAVALRLGDYKLLRFYGEQHDELYNLKKDIGEQNDLRETNLEKYQTLRAMMDQWHQENEVPIPFAPNEQFDEAHFKSTYQNMRVQ